MTIVYTSNTGHTKEYAELLAKELSCAALTLDEAKKTLKRGSDIIYLGWLMAGKVKGFSKASKKYNVKALCGVGMAATGSQLSDVKKSNKIPEGMPIFTLQGGFELDKLHGIYKIMMSTMKKTVGKGLANKSDRTPEEDDMLDMMQNGGSRVSLENLASVIAWYNENK